MAYNYLCLHNHLSYKQVLPWQLSCRWYISCIRLVVKADICLYFGSLINQKGWKLQHAFCTLKLCLVSENPGGAVFRYRAKHTCMSKMQIWQKLHFQHFNHITLKCNIYMIHVLNIAMHKVYMFLVKIQAVWKWGIYTVNSLYNDHSKDGPKYS